MARSAPGWPADIDIGACALVKAILFALFGATFVAAIPYPWIGVIASYMMALLTPQHIWYWHFEGLRAVAMVTAPTFIGFAIQLLAGRIDFGPWFNVRVLLMALLWLAYVQSYLFGPYVDLVNDYRFTQPDWAVSVINKILLMYFLALLLIDREYKLKALAWMVAVSSMYLIYWANYQYVSGNWLFMQGAQWGRLSGPTNPAGQGPYLDENNFSLFFVATLPLLWHISLLVKQWWWRGALLLFIPFGWHAIFLAGSRGGLLGLGIITFVIGFRSKYRKIGLMLLPALALAYVLQAGDTMKNRATTIDDFQTERSAATRLEAWSAAIAMMERHPITGVGIASFAPAFASFSDYQPREAHNTFFHISGESGVWAGIVYLLINAMNILTTWRLSGRLKIRTDERGLFLFHMNEAALAASIGFFVCSMFLSLQLIELFYFICLFVNITAGLSERYLKEVDPEGSTSGEAPAGVAAPSRDKHGRARKRRPSPAGAGAPDQAVIGKNP
ncbi:MAG: O-antigen ligase family protein [Burkholderiaceae bacterium]